MNILHLNNRMRLAVLSGALLGGALIYGSVTATTTDTVEPSEALVEAIPTLGEDQTQVDELPNFLLEGPQALPGISEDSTRQMGVHDGIRIWTAVNAGGEACLISLMPGPDEIAALTCAPPAAVEAGQLTLASVDGYSGGVRVSLVPEGFDDAATDDLEAAGDQLYIGDPTEATPEIDVTSDSGDTVTIPAFPGIGE